MIDTNTLALQEPKTLPDQLDIEYSLAREDQSTELVGQYTGCYGADYPLKEFMDASLISDAIIAGKYQWMVATHEGSVISSSVVVPAPWNKSFEHGRVTVFPKQYRRRGINAELCKRNISQALSQFDIGWLGMRNKPGVRFAELSGLHLAGFFPGLHKVDHRENHLLYIMVSDQFKDQRKASPHAESRYESLISRAEKELEIPKTYDEYPSEVIVGPASAFRLESCEGSINLHYEPFDNSIALGNVRGKDPIQNVDQCLSELFTFVDYVQCDVLADKIDAHDQLQEKGFEIIGYLPGWHHKQGQRYDCVRFARHSPSSSIDDQVQERVDQLQELYTHLR